MRYQLVSCTYGAEIHAVEKFLRETSDEGWGFVMELVGHDWAVFVLGDWSSEELVAQQKRAEAFLAGWRAGYTRGVGECEKGWGADGNNWGAR